VYKKVLRVIKKSHTGTIAGKEVVACDVKGKK